MAKQRSYVVLLLLIQFLARSFAQRNVTIEDTDPSISYSGNWEPSSGHPSPLDSGGTHRVSDDPNAIAQYTFTGVAVYFMSPLWPYAVGTQLRLDGQAPVELNLTDPNPASRNVNGAETVQSSVLWGSGTIPYGSHTLTISKNPSLQYAIVDAIIYTALDLTSAIPSSTISSSLTSSNNSPSSTTTSVASSTSSSSSSSSSTSNNVLPIALGAVLGALVIFIIGAVVWFCCRRRKRPKSEAWTVSGASVHESALRPPESPLPPQHPNSSQTKIMSDNGQKQPHGEISNLNPSSSWSSSTPQMSAVGIPAMTHAQIPSAHTAHTQPPQDFNPWTGFTNATHQQQQTPYVQPQPQAPYGQQQPGYRPVAPSYAPTTLSTITEKSTPWTMNSRLPMGTAPASHPSVELGSYSPPQGASGAHLSYASDLPPVSTYQPQNPYPTTSSGHLQWDGQTAGTSETVLQGKLAGEESSPVTAVLNRAEDEPEGSQPPAYSFD